MNETFNERYSMTLTFDAATDARSPIKVCISEVIHVALLSLL